MQTIYGIGEEDLLINEIMAFINDKITLTHDMNTNMNTDTDRDTERDFFVYKRHNSVYQKIFFPNTIYIHIVLVIIFFGKNSLKILKLIYQNF